jgi:hypothetical protein
MTQSYDLASVDSPQRGESDIAVMISLLQALIKTLRDHTEGCRQVTTHP